MTVQAEDITGHQTRCLNNRHTSASFSSQANFLKFQAMMLQEISQGKHNKVRETIAYHNLLLSRPLIWLSRRTHISIHMIWLPNYDLPLWTTWLVIRK